MIQTVTTKTLQVEIMVNKNSDKQYLYTLFMHKTWKFRATPFLVNSQFKL